MESLHGPLRPPFLIAKELNNFAKISFVSPLIEEQVSKALKYHNIETISLNRHLISHGSLITLEAWLRKSKFKHKPKNCLIVNFSQCFKADTHIYYAQGPVTKALKDMQTDMIQTHKLVYKLTKSILTMHDKNFTENLRKTSKIFVANSKFCASMYEDWNIKVDDIIYPPLDCEEFKPTTKNPTEDYVLTYIGKEARYPVIKDIADKGTMIKAFGFKAPYIPKYIIKHPNIKFLGKVSDKELIDLYSNALYTLFTFTHEPFGYIPIESMACETPVLTYNRQGPKEAVIDNTTGWLANTDDDLTNMAVRLWKEGFPEKMRNTCRKRALEFDAKKISVKWLSLIYSMQKA